MVDGRVIDPFKNAGVKYRRGGKRQKRTETNKEFIARIHKTFPKVITELDADLELAAMAYAIDVTLLKAAVAKSRKCETAYSKAKKKIAVKEKEVVDLPDSNPGDEIDKRLKKSNWPRDPEEKRVAVKEALMVSLFENEGDVSECSSCLNLRTHEIMEALEADEELRDMKERGLLVAVLGVEAKLLAQAKAGNTTAMKMVLTNLDGDNWSDRTSVSVKHEGFRPPADKETESGGVLRLVKGDKDA